LSIVVCLVLLAGVAVSANAKPPGTWTQITHAHNGAYVNLGLARAKNGVLHVLWAGPQKRGYTAIYDTPVSLSGAVGKPQTVVSGWVSVQVPAAATAPDGSIHAVISGQKTNSNTDPFSGLNEAVGPGSWKLGAQAFGRAPLTVPSNADVATAVLKNGQLVTAWRSATSLLFEVGSNPATAPTDITPPGLAIDPVLAVDPRTGEAVVAYDNVNEDTVYFRRLAPTLGAPQAVPRNKMDGPTIAARSAGGIFTAYVDGTQVVLQQYGGKSRKVPVPKGARALTAGVAAGPDGRLWVYYGDEQSTYVTRSSRHVSGWEPVQKLKSPPKTVQYFRLEGEGSAGPLDLFADITVDGQTKDGSYATHVQPKLSLRATKKTVKNAKGDVTGVRVTVHVTDAGDPIRGAKVTGLPGGTKTTDAKGSAVATVPAAKKGAFALVAKKPGYVAAKGKVTV
jgi:hypothetical protein